MGVLALAGFGLMAFSAAGLGVLELLAGSSRQAQQVVVASISAGMLTVVADLAKSIVTTRSLLFPQPYGGRFLAAMSHDVAKKTMGSNLGWMLMEAPSFVVPFLLAATASREPGEVFSHWTNQVALGCFMLHYFHRSFIYAARHRGSPMPVETVVGSTLFTSTNGLAQALTFTRLVVVPVGPAFYCGLAIFCTGCLINVVHDHALINLRKPSDSGAVVYRIPTTGLFRWISAANLVGEIIEWAGYAVMGSGALAPICFALETASFLGTRAVAVHHNYIARFGDSYPAGRRALIPFVF